MLDMILTREKIEEAIENETGLSVKLWGGGNTKYFYFGSQDYDIIEQLCKKHRTMILVAKLSDMTLNQWVDEFLEIWHGDDIY